MKTQQIGHSVNLGEHNDQIWAECTTITSMKQYIQEVIREKKLRTLKMRFFCVRVRGHRMLSLFHYQVTIRVAINSYFNNRFIRPAFIELID